MVPKSLNLFLLLLFFLMLLPAEDARADTGPKPTMDFEFKQEMPGEPVTITSGILYECDQPDCSDAAPLAEAGPQRFTCQANSCHALSYGFSQYHQLEIEFSDGETRRSNVFETAGFNSNYTVTVRPEDLVVEAQFSLEIFPRLALVGVVCVCGAVGIALVIGFIIFSIRRSKKK